MRSVREYFVIAAEYLDYEPLIGITVVFQPEDMERNVHIKIIDDDIVEGDEQFLVQLSSNKDQRVCLKQSNTTTITILDNDSMQLIIADSDTFAIKNRSKTTNVGLLNKPYRIGLHISMSVVFRVVWLL